MPNADQHVTHQEHRGIAARGLAAHRRRMIRALIVDHDLAEVELCLQELKRAQFSILADVVQTAAEFSNRLREQSYDVVLPDTGFSPGARPQNTPPLQQKKK